MFLCIHVRFTISLLQIREDLDLNTQEDINKFRDGANRFKQLVGYTQFDKATTDPAADKAKRDSAILAAKEYQEELAKRGLKAGKDDSVPAAHDMSLHPSAKPVSAPGRVVPGTTNPATITSQPHVMGAVQVKQPVQPSLNGGF